MKTLIAAVFGCAIMAGCATSPWHKAAWNKAGASQVEFSRDRYECLKDSSIQPIYNPVTYTMQSTDFNLFSACMGVHGWRWL
jgi:hypothetical protein